MIETKFLRIRYSFSLIHCFTCSFTQSFIGHGENLSNKLKWLYNYTNIKKVNTYLRSLRISMHIVQCAVIA